MKQRQQLQNLADRMNEETKTPYVYQIFLSEYYNAYEFIIYKKVQGKTWAQQYKRISIPITDEKIVEKCIHIYRELEAVECSKLAEVLR